MYDTYNNYNKLIKPTRLLNKPFFISAFVFAARQDLRKSQIFCAEKGHCMKNKNWIKIALDVVMAALLLMMYNKRIINLEFHEIGGLIVFGLFVIHQLFNWRWVINSTKRLFDKALPLKTKLNYVIYRYSRPRHITPKNFLKKDFIKILTHPARPIRLMLLTRLNSLAQLNKNKKSLDVWCHIKAFLICSVYLAFFFLGIQTSFPI